MTALYRSSCYDLVHFGQSEWSASIEASCESRCSERRLEATVEEGKGASDRFPQATAPNRKGLFEPQLADLYGKRWS